MKKRKTRTVLVVDDDLLVRTFFSNTLVTQGYRVITANDGIEAFNELTHNLPDIVLVDKVMPNFDGFEFCELISRIRKFHPIPIILISGQMTPEDEEEAMTMGFFDYIPKPIDETTLLRRVRWALVFSERIRKTF